MGHNGIFRNDTSDSIEGSFNQCLYSLFIKPYSLVLSLLTYFCYMSMLVLCLFFLKKKSTIYLLFCADFCHCNFFIFDWKEPVIVIFTIFLLLLTGNKRPVKSLVVGRPILLALEDIDGGPSFLEKALRFLEKYGKLWSCITQCFCISLYFLSSMFQILVITC